MNSTKSKKLHDLMQGAYDRTLIASSPKNYLPAAIDEFAKELVSNPLLEDTRQVIQAVGQQALVQVVEAKIETLNEMHHAIQIFSSYYNELNGASEVLLSHKEIILALSYILKECDKVKHQYPEMSFGAVFTLNRMLQKACDIFLWDRSQDHSERLKQLVKLDAKKNIIEYIFALSIVKLNREMEIFERDKKSSLYNSFAYLIQLNDYYDLENYLGREQAFSNHYLAASYFYAKAKDFSVALEEQESKDAIELGFDIEECKVPHASCMGFY